MSPRAFLLLEAWRMLGRQAPLIDLDQCVNAIANRFYAIERSIVLDRTRNITIMHNQRCLAGNAGQRAVPGEIVRTRNVRAALGQSTQRAIRDRQLRGVAAQRIDVDLDQVERLGRRTLPSFWIFVLTGVASCNWFDGRTLNSSCA